MRLWTQGSSWFSSEEGKKGALSDGQLADLSVLSADYFTVPDEQIKSIESVLTIVGGKVVHAAAEFGSMAPPLPPASPDWSPVANFGGYAKAEGQAAAGAASVHACTEHSFADHFRKQPKTWLGGRSSFWPPGCACFLL